MDYAISYYSEVVQEEILALPDTLAARYIMLTRRMVALGPNLGEPHTRLMGRVCLKCDLKAVKGSHGFFSARWLADALLCCTAL
jgi:hypothetical protein